MRSVFVGDIHGCFAELLELVECIAPRDDDVVISVGDFLDKGPDPERCLDFWIERGWAAVRGNKEDDFLRLLDAGSEKAWKNGRGFLRGRPDLVSFLRGLPLCLDLGSAVGVAVIHAGLPPGTPIEEDAIEARHEMALNLRFLRPSPDGWIPVAKNGQTEGDQFWAEIWDGDRTIVYGHAPQITNVPRIDARAIGIDTGCVYGGRLTAAILEHGEWRFESVPAKQAWAP